MVEEKSLTKQIEELTEKANKYENMKTRYVEHAQKIKKAAESLKQASDYLQELAKEIDPFLAISGTKTRKATNKDFTVIINEVLSKMIAGLEISVDLLQTTYSLEDREAYYVIQTLKKKNSKILTRRDENNKAVYYIQKTI